MATAAAAELRVIAAPFAESDQGYWVELTPGDILRSGDRFRLAVATGAGGPLTVSLRSSDGADVVLHKAADALPDQSIWLPSETESYVLDETLPARYTHPTFWAPFTVVGAQPRAS